MRRSSSGSPWPFQMVAYWATMRRVTFSPLPPMRIGNGFTDRARVQLRQPVDDHRHVAIEIAQARGRRAELVAVLLVIALIPAAADTEDEAAAGDVVEGAGHVGEQVRVAVAVGGDEAADLDPLRDLGHGPEGGPIVEMGAVQIAREGEEVVPVEEGVGAGGVHGLPGFAESGGRWRAAVGSGSRRGWRSSDAPSQRHVQQRDHSGPRSMATQGRPAHASRVCGPCAPPILPGR